MMTRFFILVSVALLSMPAMAQQGKTMTLRQCIDMGLALSLIHI